MCDRSTVVTQEGLARSIDAIAVLVHRVVPGIEVFGGIAQSGSGGA